MTRVLMMTLGYSFLVLGVLGLFLPFLQGILFLVVGLLILSRYTFWAGRSLDWTKRRHPRIHETIEQAEAIALRWGARVQGWFGGGTARPAAQERLRHDAPDP